MPERVEPTPGPPARVVVLVSGSGTLLGEDADQLRERIKVVARRLLVDVIERIARKGYTVNGREVSIP